MISIRAFDTGVVVVVGIGVVVGVEEVDGAAEDIVVVFVVPKTN